MNKLKKTWALILHKFKKYSPRKRKLILVSVAVCIFVIIPAFYYGIALARVSEAEINLAALRENINNLKICHEECLLVRKKQENLIVEEMRNENERVMKRLEKYWLDSGESFEFKKEIINLWRLNDDLENIPQYFYDYLDDREGEVKLQVLILSSYLSPNQDISWIDYYLNLLISDRAVSLKKEALLALSSREDKSEHFTLKQLSLLRKLMFDKSAPRGIKADIVLLIGDYLEFFSEDARNVLLEIYGSNEVDNISKAFAVDILNRYNSAEKLTASEISPDEWEKYYSY